MAVLSTRNPVRNKHRDSQAKYPFWSGNLVTRGHMSSEVQVIFNFFIQFADIFAEFSRRSLCVCGFTVDVSKLAPVFIAVYG